MSTHKGEPSFLIRESVGGKVGIFSALADLCGTFFFLQNAHHLSISGKDI
jgi:hypothetical protein